MNFKLSLSSICIVMFFGLAACNQNEQETAVATHTPTLKETAVSTTTPFITTTVTERLALPATALPSLIETPTIQPVKTPEPSPTHVPSIEPSRTSTTEPLHTPTAPPLPEEFGFRPLDLDIGLIDNLWAAPNGRIWALANTGIWEIDEENKATRLIDLIADEMVGADNNGNIWLLFDNGNSIAVYHPTTERWLSFGQEFGWQPVTETLFAKNIVADKDNNIWLAVGRDGLRHFDTETGRWETLRAGDVGFSPAPVEKLDYGTYDPSLAFMGVGLDNFNNIWVAACPIMIYTDGPLAYLLGESEGVRWFNGDMWETSSEAAEYCVLDIEVDENGSVWLAGQPNDLWTGKNSFMRYDPHTGVWHFLPVPKDEQRYHDRPAFVSNITLDEQDTPWLLVEIRGGGSWSLPSLYKQNDDDWQLMADEVESSSNVQFSTEAVWHIAYDTAFMNNKRILLPVTHIRPESFTIDGNGRAWFLDTDGTTVWQYTPPEG